MDVSYSDEEMDFIKRPESYYVESTCDDKTDQEIDSRPSTPPMDDSAKLSKSLGLIFSPHSPPCRRIRSLRLMESPVSHKGEHFIQPSFTSTPTPSSPYVRKIYKMMSKTRPKNLLNIPSPRYSRGSLNHSSTTLINPLLPPKLLDSKINSLKRHAMNKSFTFESDDIHETNLSPRENSSFNIGKLRLTDFCAPRYQKEFLELEVIGSGDHGCVFKCYSKVNGTEYAVKRSITPIYDEKTAHNEIYAHALLGHPNIVRNFSNWTENGFLYMQNEYCNGGSLEDLLKAGPLEERILRKILEHIALGLRFIHSKNLAHMDIKPGNIFMHRDTRVFGPYDTDEFIDDDDPNEETIYKIGDLGHVTRLDDVVDLEGDCRYLPREILQENYSHLAKVDIFSLGLTLYEAAGGGPLPKNGDEWHSIRDGSINVFPNICHEFNSLIKRMIHPDPDSRPTANDLVVQIMDCPIYKTVKHKHELKAAKQKIQLLEQQLANGLKSLEDEIQKALLLHSDKRVPNLFGERVLYPEIMDNTFKLLNKIKKKVMKDNKESVLSKMSDLSLDYGDHTNFDDV